MPYADSMDSGERETGGQKYQRERQAAFKSASLALEAVTPENEAIVMAILSHGHQVRMAAIDIANKLG